MPASLIPSQIQADVTTLLSRLTSGRAALLDNIPSGTMPLASAVAAIPTTPINRMQTGYLTMGAGVGSTSTAITSVDTAKSIFIDRNIPTIAAGSAPDEYHGDTFLQNATTVYGNRPTTTRGVTMGFTIVEFK